MLAQFFQVKKELKWVDLKAERAASYDYLGTNPEDVFGWFDNF